MQRTLAMIGGAAALSVLPALAQDPVTVTFIDLDGEEVGAGSITETPHGVLISVQFTGIGVGDRAFHIHETGACDAHTGFESAGDHYNPEGREHGFMVEDGPHAGDMPNLTFGEGGGVFHIFNQNVRLPELVEGDGTALVLHARLDDYESQPGGDAGDRIACAVIGRE